MENNRVNYDEIYAEAATLIRDMPSMSTSIGAALASMAIHKILQAKFGISNEEAFNIVTKITNQVEAERENGLKNLN